MGSTERRKRRGFTVLELVLGMTVMVVAVMSTMASQLAALDLVKTTREQNAAMSDLQGAMEQILILAPDKIPTPGSDFAAGAPIAAYQGAHLTAERIVPTYPGYVVGSATVPDPLTIVLTCTWNDWKGRARRMTLTSSKTR